ncbi:MAG: hypothetical protein D6737_13450 [Chloroflexi bacterium]|nr:MAG: hypothetical protein CUN54_04075 [Phototrophicales bacterium]RMF78857.1 MAG: hypothetical protein D6737_13450 [Chloroflexota bacterium]
MSGGGLFFFAIFALVLVAMYLGIRRQIGSPMMIAAGGTIASIILMALISASQGNTALHVIVVALFVGGGFSGITLAIAWYFHNTEMRAAAYRDQYRPLQHQHEVPTNGYSDFSEYEEVYEEDY